MKTHILERPKSLFLIILLLLICLMVPFRQKVTRLAQGILSQVPGLKGMIHPPPKLLTFPSLVPGQAFHPMAEKEIGSAGGTIELPNVARLEIPAGALDKPTVVKIIQVLEVESTQERDKSSTLDVSEGTVLPGYDFITPVVRLEPFGLKLNSPAMLYLPTDAARVGNNDAAIIKKTASPTAKNGEWYFSPYLEPLGSPEAPVQASIQSPIKVKYLAYVAKQFPTDVRPDQGATSHLVRVDVSPPPGKKDKR